MADLQATIEFDVELHKFYNIDLFQRGYYQIRVSFRCNSKLPYKADITLTNHENDTDLIYPSQLISGVAVSKTFKILYRKEDVDLDDRLLINCQMLVDSHRVAECIEETDFVLLVELFFSEEEFDPFNQQLSSVCERSLLLHPGPTLCLQQHVQVVFDYFHLSMVSLSLHGALLSLYQPYASLVAEIKTKNKPAPEPASFEVMLFAEDSSEPTPAVRQPRLWHACRTHRRLAQLLLRAYGGLQAALLHAAGLLPQHSDLAAVSEVDVAEKLEMMCGKVQLLKNEDDMLQVSLTHIAQLSAEAVVLWQHLQRVLAVCPALEVVLCKERHKQRISRFSEACFVQRRPKVDIMAMYEPQTHGHGKLAAQVRRSSYLRSLPVLGVECPENDGRAADMPVLFVDVYSDAPEPAEEALESHAEKLPDPGLTQRQPMVRERSVIQSVKLDTLQRPSVSRYTDLDKSAAGVQLLGYHRLADVSGSDPALAHAAEAEARGACGRAASGSLPDISVPEAEEQPRVAASLHELKASRARSRLQQLKSSLQPEVTSDGGSAEVDPSKTSSPERQEGPLETTFPVCEDENSDSSEADPDILNGLIVDPTPTPPQDLAAEPSSKRYTLLELLKEEQDRSARQEQLLSRTWSLAEQGVTSSSWVGSAAGIRVSCSSPDLMRAASPARQRQHSHAANKEALKQSMEYHGAWSSDLPLGTGLLPYFCPTSFSRFSDEPLHLVVCVHGLDGNHSDLRLVRTFLELGLPNARFEFLMSERNQHDTYSDINGLADRLVQEILFNINSFGINPDRISFVGHSLGNILIRATITRPELDELRPRFHTFLSLSGPHLGTIYGSSNLVNMGMWLMQKWKKSAALSQLAMKDHADPRRTFLYKLSQQKGLELFQNVLLVSSPQDKYVPYHSTRIEMCKAAYKDSVLGGVYQEMVVHLLSPVLVRTDCRLVRYDVYHALPASSTNSFIGRAAHIAVLDSELFLEKFFLTSTLQYFK